MQVRITVDEVSVDVRAVRLSTGRLAAAVPAELGPLLRDGDADRTLDVHVVVSGPEGTEEGAATANVVRSGRIWTEARARLRESRGWARRFARSPVEVVVLALSPSNGA